MASFVQTTINSDLTTSNAVTQTSPINHSTVTDMWDDESMPNTSPMRDFYSQKVIFLTGGTGFLGQLYVEKLLRCNVKAIYLLARAKKGKSAIERLSSLYSGALFTKLEKQDPNYMERIRVIEGNTRELLVGISETDRNDIIENVDIMIHAAADVRFDNTLKELCLINLRGTREMLRLAKECKKLQMFAYISTAFSHCDRKFIEEKFYDAPIDPELMIKIAEKYEELGDAETLNMITENLVNPWPNTYSFSKALSEEMLRKYGDEVPIVIIRPSIIISTHEDPIPAWCNNIYGLNGMLVACGLGFLRIMLFDPKLKGDIICADFVTNSTLAAIWDRKEEIKSLNMQPTKHIENDGVAQPLEPKIYNITSKKDGVTWGKINDDMYELLTEYPTQQSIWLHRTSTTKYRLIEFFLVILYHAIPGLLFDFVLTFTKNPRRLLPLYRKCHLFMVKLRYFMTQQWEFDNTNMNKVYERMSPPDQIYFPSDVRKYNWEEYRYNYHLGLLRYIGLETLQDFGPARKRMNKFRVAHFFVLVIYYSLLAGFWYFIGYLFGVNDYIRDTLKDYNLA